MLKKITSLFRKKAGKKSGDIEADFPQLKSQDTDQQKNIGQQHTLQELIERLEAMEISQQINTLKNILAQYDLKKNGELLWGELNFLMGNCYMNFKTVNEPQNLKLAVEHYELALAAFIQEGLDRKKSVWLYNELAVLYTDRMPGDPADNIEIAIKYILAGLEMVDRKQDAVIWGMYHFNLGRNYIMRYDGVRSENLKKAKESLLLAAEAFPLTSHPQQSKKVYYQLSYLHGAAQRQIPIRPGPNIDAIVTWQKNALNRHEAEEDHKFTIEAISVKNACHLQETFYENYKLLSAVQIFSSRWVVIKTGNDPVEYHIIDTQNNQRVLYHKDTPKSWLEMIHLGPYAALEVRGGVLQTDTPLELVPFNDITFWEYDCEGDSTGTSYNLPTGNRVPVFSSRPSLSEVVYIPKNIVVAGKAMEWGMGISDITNITIKCLQEGQVLVIDNATGAVLATLQAGSSNCMAAVTPNQRTLVTVTLDGVVKIWQVK